MPAINGEINALFWQICGGTSVGFLSIIFVLALSRKLFGVLENDEDWNG